ncbi:hypothetical protein HY933_00870 [Candidatus Falkowbacteria bacterium]|nr:hypothetical protein [Candidatus Falkowbacteria bacterium]
MFDYQPKTNQPQRDPEDIFAAVDTAPAGGRPAAPRPSTPLPAPRGAAVPPPMPGEQRNVLKIVIIVLVVLIVLALLAIAGRYVYLRLSQSAPAPDTVNTPAGSTAVNFNEPTVPPATFNNNPVGPSAALPADTDADGLTDVEEARLGTDPLLADTDVDGLFDNQEVNQYKTDPLNPDTDGDGYSDGQEVAGGYNPLGSGRLFDVVQ